MCDADSIVAFLVDAVLTRFAFYSTESLVKIHDVVEVFVALLNRK